MSLSTPPPPEKLTMLSWNPSRLFCVFSLISHFYFVGKFDYFENQGRLHELHAVVSKDKYVIASSVHSWYEEFINWGRKHKPVQYFEQTDSNPCK